MMKIVTLALLFAIGCGGSKTPQTPPASPTPAPVVQDDRCAAPQVWIESGCTGSPEVEGCFLRCNKPGATSEERLNPSACPAGTTCTQFMRKTRLNENVGGVGEACSGEDQICMPTPAS